MMKHSYARINKCMGNVFIEFNILRSQLHLALQSN